MGMEHVLGRIRMCPYCTVGAEPTDRTRVVIRRRSFGPNTEIGYGDAAFVRLRDANGREGTNGQLLFAQHSGALLYANRRREVLKACCAYLHKCLVHPQHCGISTIRSQRGTYSDKSNEWHEKKKGTTTASVAGVSSPRPPPVPFLPSKHTV